MSDNTIGLNIKKYREMRGFTQKQLADAVGKSKNVVSNWESGLNKPDPVTIELILDFLGIDANTLYGWEDKYKIKADADRLADKLLSNPIIKEVLPQISELDDTDMELVINFIKRLSNK